MNDDVKDYAEKINQKLLEAGIRTELDTSNNSMGKKARKAIVDKVFYLVTVGETEKKENKIAVRSRDSKDIKVMDLDKFIKKLKKEIESK